MLFYGIFINKKQRGAYSMKFVYFTFYFAYLAFSALQLLFAPYRSAGKLDWGSVAYHAVATAAVAVFNWELYLLRGVYDEPAKELIVWFATSLLAVVSYYSLSYYPQLKLNPFWKRIY